MKPLSETARLPPQALAASLEEMLQEKNAAAASHNARVGETVAALEAEGARYLALVDSTAEGGAANVGARLEFSAAACDGGAAARWRLALATTDVYYLISAAAHLCAGTATSGAVANGAAISLQSTPTGPRRSSRARPGWSA